VFDCKCNAQNSLLIQVIFIRNWLGFKCFITYERTIYGGTTSFRLPVLLWPINQLLKRSIFMKLGVWFALKKKLSSQNFGKTGSSFSLTLRKGESTIPPPPQLSTFSHSCLDELQQEMPTEIYWFLVLQKKNRYTSSTPFRTDVNEFLSVLLSTLVCRCGWH